LLLLAQGRKPWAAVRNPFGIGGNSKRAVFDGSARHGVAATAGFGSGSLGHKLSIDKIVVFMLHIESEHPGAVNHFELVCGVEFRS